MCFRQMQCRCVFQVEKQCSTSKCVSGRSSAQSLNVFQVEAMHNLPSGVDQLQKDVVKQTQKLAIVEGDWQRKFQRLADNVTSQVSMVSKMQVTSQASQTCLAFSVEAVLAICKDKNQCSLNAAIVSLILNKSNAIF